MFSSCTSVAQKIHKTLHNKYSQTTKSLVRQRSENSVPHPPLKRNHYWHSPHYTRPPHYVPIHVPLPLEVCCKLSFSELSLPDSLTYCQHFDAGDRDATQIDFASHFTPLTKLTERPCCDVNEWSVTREGLIRINTRRGRHKERQTERRPLPKLFYIQNPLAWFVNKIDFVALEQYWDPEFDEMEFRRGAKQALSTVTQLVAAGNFDDLKGLLVPSAVTCLKRESETIWGQKRQHLGVTPDDIQIALPRKVHFNSIIAQRFCDIDMMFVALKWVDEEAASYVVYLETIARFHREYTESRVSDWTISLFRITKFKAFPGYGKLL